MGVAAGYIHKNAREFIRKFKAFSNRNIERQAIALASNVKPSRLVVPDDEGHVKFDGAGLGIKNDLDTISALATGWMKDPMRAQSDKPFLRNILNSQDVLENPEFMRVATHGELLGAVTRYLGQVPWLVNLAVWWTPPNSTAIRSQLWHYDHRDTRQAKIFINLNDVGIDAGPLHFLAAGSCKKVDSTIGYTQDEYTDQEIASCVSEDEILKATGSKGSGYIVDTARCLHYGSRGNSKDRLILMISYARANCVSKGSGSEVLDPIRDQINAKYFSNDPARRFANQQI